MARACAARIPERVTVITILPASPTVSQSSLEHAGQACEANTSDEVYEFDFGKHCSQTIKQVADTSPSYLLRCLINEDMMETRIDLADGLRALSNDFLNSQSSSLREAMRKRGIHPHDIADALMVEGQDDHGNFWNITKWDRVIAQNVGPEFEQVNIGGSLPTTIMFTGTIVRVEQCWADEGEDGLMTFTILPCGFPRTETIKCYFISSATAPLYEELPDMLYKMYKVVGKFCSPGLYSSIHDIKSIELARNPEPASLKTGICWKFEGRVTYACIKPLFESVLVTYLEVDRDARFPVYAKLLEGAPIPTVGKLYRAKGITIPEDVSENGLGETNYYAKWLEELPEPNPSKAI